MLLALASFSVTRFLRHYLGDVLQWVTYEETDVKNQKRREILNLGFNTLLHLPSSKQCERLVVVGHSLGSAIAMDSLLELRRHALTQSHQGGTQPLPFEKLTDFITLGSPIDRIHYFFESYRVKKSKRYGSVVEKVRGDLGTEPFTGRTPVRWVNVHDRSDVISSALHTPNATSKNKILAVENVKTGSYLFPLLPVAHSSYFQSRVALKFIFEAVFGDRPVHGGRPLTRWESGAQDLDPGRTRRRTTFMAVAILLALASLRLLFDAKPKDEEKPPSSSPEAHPTSDVQNVGKWTTGLSQVMAYIGVAWIWILAFLLTIILFAVQPLITPFLLLLLVATGLLIFGLATSAVLRQLDSVYRKAD